MIIRPTTEGDWAELKRIRLAALLDAPTAFGVSYATAAANSDEQWRARASSETLPEFFLAWQNDEAVGMAGGGVDSSGQYNLIGMWVQPECRGSGAARLLVEAVKESAVAHGHDRVVLDVSPANSRAANFYRNQGFVFTDEWEPLASHPEILVRKMEWHANALSDA
jgi:ribosomal protein S18 acetylase RimI-like enzyme